MLLALLALLSAVLLGNLRCFGVNYDVSRITHFLCYFSVKKFRLCYVFTLFHLWRATITNSVLFSNSEFEHLDVFDVTELHRRHCLLNNLVVVGPRLSQCGYSAGVRLWIILQFSWAALKEENVKTSISRAEPSQTFWWIL